MVGSMVVTAAALSATRSSADSRTGVHTIVQAVVSEIAFPTTIYNFL